MVEEYSCKAQANVVNFFDEWLLIASRDGKWKWIYLTFVPAKTCNVGIRILIWILNGCIRFVFGKSLLHPHLSYLVYFTPNYETVCFTPELSKPSILPPGWVFSGGFATVTVVW